MLICYKLFIITRSHLLYHSLNIYLCYLPIYVILFCSGMHTTLLILCFTILEHVLHNTLDFLSQCLILGHVLHNTLGFVSQWLILGRVLLNTLGFCFTMVNIRTMCYITLLVFVSQWLILGHVLHNTLDFCVFVSQWLILGRVLHNTLGICFTVVNLETCVTQHSWFLFHND